MTGHHAKMDDFWQICLMKYMVICQNLAKVTRNIFYMMEVLLKCEFLSLKGFLVHFEKYSLHFGLYV
jgi:hypothetical protein